MAKRSDTRGGAGSSKTRDRCAGAAAGEGWDNGGTVLLRAVGRQRCALIIVLVCLRLSSLAQDGHVVFLNTGLQLGAGIGQETVVHSDGSSSRRFYGAVVPGMAFDVGLCRPSHGFGLRVGGSVHRGRLLGQGLLYLDIALVERKWLSHVQVGGGFAIGSVTNEVEQRGRYVGNVALALIHTSKWSLWMQYDMLTTKVVMSRYGPSGERLPDIRYEPKYRTIGLRCAYHIM